MTYFINFNSSTKEYFHESAHLYRWGEMIMAFPVPQKCKATRTSYRGHYLRVTKVSSLSLEYPRASVDQRIGTTQESLPIAVALGSNPALVVSYPVVPRRVFQARLCLVSVHHNAGSRGIFEIFLSKT